MPSTRVRVARMPGTCSTPRHVGAGQGVSFLVCLHPVEASSTVAQLELVLLRGLSNPHSGGGSLS